MLEALTVARVPDLLNLVVDGTSSTLDSGVSAEVEVVLEGLSNASLNKCTGKRVGVLVNTALREEANVMTLGSDDDQESGHNVDLGEGLLHGGDLLVDDQEGWRSGAPERVCFCKKQ